MSERDDYMENDEPKSSRWLDPQLIAFLIGIAIVGLLILGARLAGYLGTGVL